MVVEQHHIAWLQVAGRTPLDMARPARQLGHTPDAMIGGQSQAVSRHRAQPYEWLAASLEKA
jgi:hypothetical protein